MKNAHRMKSVLAAYVVLTGAVCALAQDWPQWRGPNRDNKVTGFTRPRRGPRSCPRNGRLP